MMWYLLQFGGSTHSSQKSATSSTSNVRKLGLSAMSSNASADQMGGFAGNLTIKSLALDGSSSLSSTLSDNKIELE